MRHREKDYVLHSVTTSLCSTCSARVPAKVLLRAGAVHLAKLCAEHGPHEELLEEDAGFYLRQPEYDKPGSATPAETSVDRGCPYDCGLCPDHEQHTCIGLIEVTGRCDLGCPVCFAESGRPGGRDLDLTTIGAMLDAFQAAESGEAEVLQISGGEPTTHPEILEIIRLARVKGIRYVMLNTNGLRIAADPAFAAALGEFAGGFEVYLQFDGFDRAASAALRGRDVVEVKLRALENLAANGVPATLVTTVQGGLNEHELGRIVEFGISSPAVRGVNFQPLTFFGRTDGMASAARITRTGVMKRLAAQTSGMVSVSDFFPLPCDVERVAFCLLYRDAGRFVPITRRADIRKYLPLIGNTMAFRAEDILRDAAGALCGGGCDCLGFLKDLAPFTGLVARGFTSRRKAAFTTENLFRISVTAFLDRFNFEMKAMKKECVHMLTPDLRRIPFSAYNLIHREAMRHEVSVADGAAG